MIWLADCYWRCGACRQLLPSPSTHLSVPIFCLTLSLWWSSPELFPALVNQSNDIETRVSFVETAWNRLRLGRQMWDIGQSEKCRITICAVSAHFQWSVYSTSTLSTSVSALCRWCQWDNLRVIVVWSVRRCCFFVKFSRSSQSKSSKFSSAETNWSRKLKQRFGRCNLLLLLLMMKQILNFCWSLLVDMCVQLCV